MVHKHYHISQQRTTITVCYKIRSVKILGARISTYLNFMCIGHQYRTCFVSLFQCVEFLKICGPLAKTGYHVTKYIISYFIWRTLMSSLSFCLSRLSHFSFFCHSEMAVPTKFCKLWDVCDSCTKRKRIPEAVEQICISH